MSEKPRKNTGHLVGMQYALWKFTEGHTLLVSTDEIEYLSEGSVQPYLVTTNINSSYAYTIGYGVFRSQIDWHENMYDLSLAKGATYFYLDSQKNVIRDAVIKDFIVLAKNDGVAKVCVLLRTNKAIPFPEGDNEFSITLTRLMPGLGNQLKDLIFSRIEYGTLRMDHGVVIESKNRSHWKNFIDMSYLFKLGYVRLLTLPDEDE